MPPAAPTATVSSIAPSASTRFTLRAWCILLSIGLALMFFSLDRGVVAILKTTLGSELGFDNTGYSLLVTAFMVPYTLTYLWVGGVVDRLGARRALAIAVLVMSVATIAGGFTRNLTELAAARILLGISEAAVVPAVSVAVFLWFSADRRASAWSVANLIQASGSVLAPPFVSFITLAAGWRWAFFVPGALGIAVAVFWWESARVPPDGVATAKEERPPGERSLALDWRVVFASPTIRAVLLARVITDPFWFFFQYWQVAFLQERVSMSLARVGQLMWIPPLVVTLVMLGISLFSDRLVSRGWAPARARTALLMGITLLSPCSFALPFASSEMSALLLLLLVLLMAQGWITLTMVLMGDIAPRHALGTSIGIMSALGGTGAIIFNAAAGPLIDQFGFELPFLFGAALHPIAALIIYINFRKTR